MTPQLFKRILNLSKSSSFFLFGPRGVGKSHLLKSYFSDTGAYRIDLLNPTQVHEFQRNPSRLKQLCEALPIDKKWVVIDEIQKVPELLDVVHDLIESTDLKFALTGSSARKLKRGGANLLAGRAFEYTLHPLTAFELDGTNIAVIDVLDCGSLPRVFTFDARLDKIQFLKAYCGTYLKEEIKEEQIVRKVEPFINFLEIAAQSDGKIVNYTNIARDVDVDVKTVQSFFQILEDTLLGFKLNPFHESLRKRQNKSPKFYFFDIGVSRALARSINSPIVESSFEYGNRFEQMFILNCFALNKYYMCDYSFSYLRTKDDFEVDLIIDRPGKTKVFIEIKSTHRIQLEDFSSLERFAKENANYEFRVASQDEVHNKNGQVHFVHWKALLKELFS